MSLLKSCSGITPKRIAKEKDGGKRMEQIASVCLQSRPGPKVGNKRGFRKIFALIAALSTLGACATGSAPRRDSALGVAEVRSTELKFAQAMADRDFAAFVSHLSGDAVFFDERNVQRGAAEVSAAWKPLFAGSKAPFSWAPDHVEVLASGNLALSTGPVIVDNRVIGRFNSIWRLEAPHIWRIVFDKGEPVCAVTK